MNTKASAGAENNVASQAEAGPVGYIYLYPTSQFPVEEASLLGNLYLEGNTLSIPLLQGLTVESTFSFNVKAIHKRIDPTSVLARVSSYHRELVVFHNTSAFNPIVDIPGLDTLCKKARCLFGFSEFKAQTTNNTDITWLCSPHYTPQECIGAVAITEVFKERLYGGHLVAVKHLTREVTIGQMTAHQIPLYDRELFRGSSKLPTFYNKALSEHLHARLFTPIAQALRVRDVSAIIDAMENQSIQDQYKMSKITQHKEYAATITQTQDYRQLMIVDAAATELAASYGLSFIEAPHEISGILNYETWPIFERCVSRAERLDALKRWNAQQAIHIHAQIFSTNSILYITKVKRLSDTNQKPDSNSYNNYFLSHGLADLHGQSVNEHGSPTFPGIPKSDLDCTEYSSLHLAYAASFSPNLLARMCYYLQFAYPQKSLGKTKTSMAQYITGAASSPLCEYCSGNRPNSCIETLIFRLKDRFPPINTGQKRDPYVITGTSGPYSDLELLGNFASFREKDDGCAQGDDDKLRYAYSQLCETFRDKLEALGIGETDGETLTEITNIRSFLQVFRDLDTLCENEATEFINKLTVNNVNYRETIRNIANVLQISCNPNWQAPCSVFNMLFYRTILNVIQDIALPICMTYELENPTLGQTPSDWLKMHFQTLWTNFKSCCMDRGVMTGSQVNVIHKEGYTELFDPDLILESPTCPVKMQLRLSRAALTIPKTIKAKHRIVMSSAITNEHVQNSFAKPSTPREKYITLGPYVKFLYKYHRVLFPNTKISPFNFWNIVSDQQRYPNMEGVDPGELKDLVTYINVNSRLHDTRNVFDICPTTMAMYAIQKLNNHIMQACGQTQHYAGILCCLCPTVQENTASDFPHAMGQQRHESVSEYQRCAAATKAIGVQTSALHYIGTQGKLRPVITLPIIVNKYTGINGNATLFQSGNMGYFCGFGVDKNLLPESGFARRTTTNSQFRKKFVFMVPIYGNLIKKYVPTTGAQFEVEAVRRNILAILNEKNTTEAHIKILVELIKHFGTDCKTLTSEDLQFLLGPHCPMGDYILEVLQEFEIPPELAQNKADIETFVRNTVSPQPTDYELVTLDSQTSGTSATELVSNVCQSTRKRKLDCILDSLEL
ncbi:ICP8 [Phascolarctid gammaherpesvirus 1]|uniref:ICP8 n=1 Tax=Phascolarctid gammaherpesvirus 1 TaxID=2249313 RepID=A0A3S8D7F7_9GAMA|nr:ICP8 [Phascolarctid gammaherpesvirus 1]AZB49184.1 ICP8 [Phascolarctid gammaherpesvirus 1]